MLMVEAMHADFQMKREKGLTVFQRFYQMFNRRTGSCTVDLWSGRNFLETIPRNLGGTGRTLQLLSESSEQ